MSLSLPTLVIGGYLGAGKTTLVNHLLRHAQGQKIAVLVNDFGDINIDADLIQGQSGDVMTLSGGCVCCSFGADLVGALMAMTRRDPAPDLILIETSGVALPGAVARSARLVTGLSILGVVTVLDASALMRQISDRYVAGTVRQQIQDANLLLLNKADLMSTEVLPQIHAQLSAIKTGAPIVATSHADFPLDLLQSLGNAPQTPPHFAQPSHRLMRQDHLGGGAVDRFESRSWQWQGAMDVQSLKIALDRHPQILRAKGRVRDAANRRWIVQKVGSQSTIVEFTPKDDENSGSQLVVITLKGHMPEIEGQIRGVETQTL